MERFIPLLLEVWREACRHIEIGEMVERVAPLLRTRLPADLVVIRRLDIQRGTMETVCREGGLPDEAPVGEGVTVCSLEQVEAILLRLRGGRVLRGSAEQTASTAPGLLPASDRSDRDVLAGGLTHEGELIGALILVSAAPSRFRPEHERLFESVLEPFSAALENDRRLHELLRLREMVEADNRALLSKLGRQDISDAIVGAETGLRHVMERVELVAPADAPVLILGETGSGKEVVARAIHERSRRQDGPFLRVNCGAIPTELIDSELFGHERGSFTGAVSLRKGWFERADGGTLFLDEVGELTPAAQVRLLRVLQDGIFERVGGQKLLRVNVRVVAATNADLVSMTGDGRFRQDLWYRLAVFPIQIPPLRDRPDDIVPLAAHFALRSAKRLGMPALVPTPDDNDLLLRYAWPGNARELAAVIERAAILGNGRTLEVAKALGGASGSSDLPTVHGRATPSTGPTEATIETLDDAMRRHIERALAGTRGRVEGPDGAALLLGINPNTLRGRMRKLGIDGRKHRRR